MSGWMKVISLMLALRVRYLLVLTRSHHPSLLLLYNQRRTHPCIEVGTCAIDRHTLLFKGQCRILALQRVKFVTQRHHVLLQRIRHTHTPLRCTLHARLVLGTALTSSGLVVAHIGRTASLRAMASRLTARLAALNDDWIAQLTEQRRQQDEYGLPEACQGGDLVVANGLVLGLLELLPRRASTRAEGAQAGGVEDGRGDGASAAPRSRPRRGCVGTARRAAGTRSPPRGSRATSARRRPRARRLLPEARPGTRWTARA